MDPCFSSRGFKNWKKAIEKFQAHQKCHAHLQAVLAHSQKKNPIETQLNAAIAVQQKEARACLIKIITSLQFLARQGLAIRGHENCEGNFNTLLKLRTQDSPLLEKWLNKEKNKMTHSDVQNEILQIMAHEILRKICMNINTQKLPIFSIICDSTHDISGFEQESICIRYVDEDLNPIENFIGLYIAKDMTAEGITAILKDIMIRMQLPIANLRGQAYDGAPVMCGIKGGVQALIKKTQPLSLFVHCGAHCINLVIKDMCEVSKTVRNALQWAHELGALFNQSAKAKTQFINIREAEKQGPVTNVTKIKPLCPTRWIYRFSQIEAILSNYSSVLDTLEELSKDLNSNSASGLLKLFESGTTVLGFFIVKDLVAQLEIFNKCLQTRQLCVSSMITAIADLTTLFQDLRSEQTFHAILDKAVNFIKENNLEEISLPRIRKVPKRFGGLSEEFSALTIEKHFMIEYFAVIDAAIMSLNMRFNQEDLLKVNKLEKTILKENFTESESILKRYSEIDISLLESELKLFHKKYEVSSISDIIAELKLMPKELRNMFTNLENLIRILIVLPSSSCEAERSFSCLRRLKNYLKKHDVSTKIKSFGRLQCT